MGIRDLRDLTMDDLMACKMTAQEAGPTAMRLKEVLEGADALPLPQVRKHHLGLDSLGTPGPGGRWGPPGGTHIRAPERCPHPPLFPQLWRLVSKHVLHPDLPFPLHVKLYKAAYAGWDGEAQGPPPSWVPDPDAMRDTNIARFMQEWKVSSFAMARRDGAARGGCVQCAAG